jgi:predicted nucleotidyltransferase
MQEQLKLFFAERQDILFAWLFGSCATGHANNRSDVDIAVFVSDAALLEDVDWYLGLKVELMELMRREVDLILLNAAKPLIKHAANLHKVSLLSRDPLFEAEYSLRIIHEYNDVRYWAQRSRQHLLGGKKHGQA